MWSRFLCVLFVLSCGCVTGQAQSTRWRGCLPDGVTADEVVSVNSTGAGAPARLTVGRRLTQLKARCRRGQLVDGRGRRIRFHRLEGCWGNPPADYLERLERQRRTLRDLKRRYTVIEMTCNASGIPVP
jgi:hypothetical protein